MLATISFSCKTTGEENCGNWPTVNHDRKTTLILEQNRDLLTHISTCIAETNVCFHNLNINFRIVPKTGRPGECTKKRETPGKNGRVGRCVLQEEQIRTVHVTTARENHLTFEYKLLYIAAILVTWIVFSIDYFVLVKNQLQILETIFISDVSAWRPSSGTHWLQ